MEEEKQKKVNILSICVFLFVLFPLLIFRISSLTSLPFTDEGFYGLFSLSNGYFIKNMGSLWQMGTLHIYPIFFSIVTVFNV